MNSLRKVTPEGVMPPVIGSIYLQTPFADDNEIIINERTDVI
jgi:hypothetical protein